MSKVVILDNLLLVKDVATGQYMPFDNGWEFNGDFEKPTFLLQCGAIMGMGL